MESATVLRSSFGFIKPSSSFARTTQLTCSSNLSYSTNNIFPGWQQYPSISYTKAKHAIICYRYKKTNIVVKASSHSESGPVAPLQLESPIGQFLSEILVSHPHLVPAAVDQQLEQLQTDISSEKNEASSATGNELVLYRRIAEVKASERNKALEEILYALVVQRFMAANISLVPTMSSSSPDSRVDTWPPQEEKLQRLHSSEAYEMVQNHLTLILGNKSSDPTSVALIGKLKVGQVYAASAMYGYFLKRIDQRFQLEKSMKLLADKSRQQDDAGNALYSDDLRATQFENAGFAYGIRSSRLRTYVMSFDQETLQSYATIRSKEAINIIEKHTEALFGRAEIKFARRNGIESSDEEVMKIGFVGLKGLILEAVSFGSFLWDVESYVDSRCHFVMN